MKSLIMKSNLHFNDVKWSPACRFLQNTSVTLFGRATYTTRITNATFWQHMWQSATHIKSASAGDGTIFAVRK